MLKYRNMTEEQKAKKKESVLKRRAERIEEWREYKRKRRAEHIEEYRERMRKYRAEHREDLRKYKDENLNSSGKRKSHIRKKSGLYLFRKHSKLEGYEIHHCFSYEDHKKFIYIPKTLHLKIHQLLRDNNIPADSDHWMAIRDLVNSCEEYTYISV